jgi:hypothetical protein
VATKSLVTRVDIDSALRAHNCQANRRHRLERGDTRLKVRNGRGWDHYCRLCAAMILERDIVKLGRLLAGLQPSVRRSIATEAVEVAQGAPYRSRPSAICVGLDENWNAETMRGR